MSYQDELYNLAREIDAAVATVGHSAQEAERAPLVWPLPGKLGNVTVSGGGELVEVAIDIHEMKQYSADGLARQLLQEIQQAEQAADQHRRSVIATAVEEAGLA